jgi:hypothetical protein
MRLAFTGVSLFVVAFLIHLLWWRIRLPYRQLQVLFKWFMLFFPIGLGGANALGLWSSGWLVSPATAVVALLYFSLTITYVITYSALEADSPTLSLMRWVAQRPDGASEAELESFMASRPFIQARLKALDVDGMTVRREGRVYLNGQPSLFFRIIIAWRVLYGPIDKGG